MDACIIGIQCLFYFIHASLKDDSLSIDASSLLTVLFLIIVTTYIDIKQVLILTLAYFLHSPAVELKRFLLYRWRTGVISLIFVMRVGILITAVMSIHMRGF